MAGKALVYYVYIMSNRAGTLYTGVTNNLERRVEEHRLAVVSSFSGRYRLTQLVYFEEFGDVREAIGREKQIKGMSRAKKIGLVERINPEWKDLAKNNGPRERKLGD